METRITLTNNTPGILSIPPNSQGKLPAILLFHGFASNKNEVGDLFSSIADGLKQKNIASLRIDFSGFGESPVDSSSIIFDDMLRDAELAHQFLSQHQEIDPDQISACGFSLGTAISILLSTELEKKLQSIVMLAPIGDLLQDFYLHVGTNVVQRALASDPNKLIEILFDWRESVFLRSDFFHSLLKYDLKKRFTHYLNPVFIVAGTDDFTLPHAEKYFQLSSSDYKKFWPIQGANHIFNFSSDNWPLGSQITEQIVSWFTTQFIK